METTDYDQNLDGSDPEDDAKEAEENAAIVERAKAFYRRAMDASSTWRQSALEDLEFLAGEQWDPSIKGARDAQQRPALTVNRLPQFVRQVTNEQRQSKPAVTVNPVDSGGDIRTAEVLQGVIRNVEYSSNADAAYAAGGQSAAITGIGYWDVCAEYEDERSFEQRLVIRRISNALSVAMDPAAKELAGDDAREVILSADMSKAEWKARFPDREMPKSEGWKGEGDAAASWVSRDGVRIHEYRYVTEEPDTLIQVPPGVFADMPDGGPALKSELGEGVQEQIAQAEQLAAAKAALAGEKYVPQKPRSTTRRKACWAKIVGDDVIEKGELAGKYLQLVRVVGTELEINGNTIYEGVVRHAKDTQRMLNYFVSAEAEAIALTPKAPFIGTAKQFENYETIWETANQRPSSYLPYNPDPQAGGPPQRVMAEANVQAITNARMQAADDLKAVTGIYDAALGARSNEQSGRAILARQSQGQTANFHFQDNLAMAIRYTGRILIDLIPKIYSGPRTLRILGEDGKHEMVPVNGAEGDFRGEPALTPEGPLVDLNAGRYDVAVTMGPSFQSRRQESAAMLTELAKMSPVVMGAAGDLVVKSMDIPGGNEIAKRIEKTLPPEIRPPDEKTPPPQVLAQNLQQAMQMVEQLTGQLNDAKDAIERDAENNESKERVEFTKLRVQLALKLAELESAESVAILKAEHAAMTKRLQLTGINEPVEDTEPQGAMNG